MRKALVALGALTVLAGCSSAPPEVAQSAPPQPARAEAPPATPAPIQTPAPAATPGHDQCGAYEVQNLVGRLRSEIPVPLDPSRQRVACTTCPVTQDFNPTRLNFFFDAGTGIIKQIRCG